MLHREGSRLILELPEQPVDKLGWPVDFWQIFGGLGDDFDLGDRTLPNERLDPLGRRR